MKNPLKKTGRLGIVLMLVFGLFLSSCKKEIYPSLKKDLLGYQGSNPIVQDVIAELKKPQHNELLRRLGQHGSINWNDPKILLTTSFPDGLSMRFYSADSNYFDARINAQTKAIQLLDRTQLQTEAAKANAQMQQASIAKAKQMGRKTTSNTDPNWPLCNQPGAEGMCQQTIDAELEIRDPFYDLDLSNREQVYSFVQTKLFYGDFFAYFSLALRNRGYERYVYGAKWINRREVKTREEIIFDLWNAYAETIYGWNYLKLPQTVMPKMKILWVEPGSTCCPAPQKPVGGGGGAIPDPLSERDRLLVERLIAEDDAEDAFLATKPICYGTGRTGNVKFNGTIEHWLIQFDYVTTVAGGVREYSIPTAGSSGIRAGYADIANTITGDMFEIKSVKTGQGAAFSDIVNYVSLAGRFCPPPSSGTWRLGMGYTTRYLKYPGDLGSVLMVWSPAPGVVLYNKIAASNSPVPVPVLLPDNLAQKIKDFIKSLTIAPVDLERKITQFLRNNPDVRNYIKAAAAALIIATLAEDFLTGGGGIFNDAASFNLARIMWRVASTI